jgi:hypothetical protein
MEAQLIYFKSSGKFYADDTIPLTEAECNGEYYNIGDRLRQLSHNKELPCITGDWLGEHGFIVALQENIGWPVLVKHPLNQYRNICKNCSYIPGKETQHNIKIITFKQHGKYDTEETINLDESCISNGVALTHVIADKVYQTHQRRGCYTLICSPPDELSGCPHLLLPTH